MALRSRHIGVRFLSAPSAGAASTENAGASRAYEIETLEPRILLSATPFLWSAPANTAQTLELAVADVLGVPTIQLSNATGVLKQQSVADTTLVDITLSNRADRITIASDFSGVTPVSIQGQSGIDVVVGPNGGQNFTLSSTGGTVAGVSFSGFERVQGGDGADRFAVSAGGLLPAILGGGGSDSVVVDGTVASSLFQALGAGTATLRIGASLLGMSSIESVDDRTAVDVRTINASPLDDTISVTGRSGGGATVVSAAMPTYSFTTPQTRVLIDAAGGRDSIEVSGSVDLSGSGLELRAEQVRITGLLDTFAAVGDAGYLTVRAIGQPLSVQETIPGFGLGSVSIGSATIELDGATVATGAVTLAASINLAQNASGSDLALLLSSATARVNINNSSIGAIGAVAVSATTTQTVTADALAAGPVAADTDSAVVAVVVDDTTAVTLNDSSITAVGTVTLSAIHTASVTATASGGDGSAGAVVANTIVTGRTKVETSGETLIETPGNVTLTALSVTTAATEAAGAPGGADGDSAAAAAALERADAETPDGDVRAASTVAVALIDRSTSVILGGQAKISARAVTLDSVARHAITTSAEAGEGDGVTLANAVAVNRVTDRSSALVTGAADVALGDGSFTVRAGPSAGNPSRSTATAISGESAQAALGLAGALALNVVSADAEAGVPIGGFVTVSGGPAQILARSNTVVTTTAEARADTGPNGLGVGASVAIGIVDSTVGAIVGTESPILGAESVSIQATGLEVIETTAVGGAEGQEGQAGALALTVASSRFSADIDPFAGVETSGTVTIQGNADLAASATASGGAASEDVAVGTILAVTVAAQKAHAGAAGFITAGSLSMTARQRSDIETTATAALGGAAASGDAAAQAASAPVGYGAAAGGVAVASPEFDAPGGAMGVAGALSVTVLSGAADTTIAGSADVTTTGAITVRAQQDADSSTIADASTTDPSAAADVLIGGAAAATIMTQTADASLVGRVAGSAVTITAGTAADTPAASNALSIISTRAVSGAAADSLGIAGALAQNTGGLDATATLADGSRVVSPGTTTVNAATATDITAEAVADVGGGGIGIGAGIAVSLLDSDASARMLGDATVQGGGLSLIAAGVNASRTVAESGSGEAGAFAVLVSSNDSLADLAVGNGMTLGGSVTVSALQTSSGTVEARAAGDGEVAAIAATMALGVAADSAEASIARSVATEKSVVVSANVDLDLDVLAKASARGAPASGTADNQVSAMADLAGRSLDIGSLSSPGSDGSATPLAAAAAMSVAVASGGSTAALQSGGSVSGSTLSVRATGDVDSKATANGRTVDDTAAGIGIGAAAAVSTGVSSFNATVDGSANVRSLSVSAGSPALGSSEIAAVARSGAGADEVGLAAAFASASSAMTASADLNGAVAGQPAAIVVTSTLTTDTDAIARSDSAAGDGAIGIGASIAVAFSDNTSQATLGTAATVADAASLSLSAKGAHVVSSNAVAGSEGAAGITPSVALSLSENDTSAIAAAGAAITLTGAFSALATHTVAADATADSMALGRTFGLGAAVAANIVLDTATARPDRSITAGGNVTVTADLIADLAADAIAGAGMAKGGDADGQVAAIYGLASSVGGALGLSDSPELAQMSQDGDDAKVSVAAGLALNVADATATASIPVGVSLSSGRTAVVESRLDVDAQATADASAVAGNVGIGVAVGLNVITAENRASIDGALVGRTIRVAAISSDRDTNPNTFGAKANAGAGEADVGIAGAFALTSAAVSSRALVNGTVSAGSGGLEVKSRQRTNSETEASGEIDGGETVGIGAAAAISLSRNVSDAAILGSVLLATGAITVEAVGTHEASVNAEAGAAGGVAVSPAIAVHASGNSTSARIGAGAAITGGNALTINAQHGSTIDVGSDASSAGDLVSVGAAVAVAYAAETASTSVARDISVSRAVSITSTNQTDASADAVGGAKGSAKNGPSSDKVASDAASNPVARAFNGGAALELPSIEALVANASNESSGELADREVKGVSVGAAVAVVAGETGSQASLANGVTVRSTAGGVTVRSGLDLDGKAKAEGSAITPTDTVGVGAAFAISSLKGGNNATIGSNATVTARNAVTLAADGTTVTGDGVNMSEAVAIGGGGGRYVGLAGSVAVNSFTIDTGAEIGTDAAVRSATGGVTVEAGAEVSDRVLAGAGVFSLGLAVGASFAIDMIDATTIAAVGNGASIDAGADIDVRARFEMSPGDGSILPGDTGNVSAGAIGGAVSDLAIGVQVGAAAVQLADIETRALIGAAARINQGGVAARPDQDVLVEASSDTVSFAAGGAGGAALTSAGVGPGVALVLMEQTTSASIGSSAVVKAGDDIDVRAISLHEQDVLAGSASVVGAGVSIPASLAVGKYAGITSAEVDDAASLTARGAIGVTAGTPEGQTDSQRVLAGSAALKLSEGGGAVGAAVAVIKRDDVVSATTGTGSTLTMVDGLRVVADSAENLSATAVGAAGGEGKAGAGSATTTLVTETTVARIGESSVVRTGSNTARPGDVVVTASDDTKVSKLAGAAAFGGTGGYGAAVDYGEMTKSTEATIGVFSDIETNGSVEVRANGSEDVASHVIHAEGGAQGFAGGAASAQRHQIYTRAEIEGQFDFEGLGRATHVLARNNVVVEAASDAEYDLMAGGLSLAAGGGIGAAAVVPEITKMTYAGIGSYADVTARGLGAAAAIRNGQFTASYVAGPGSADDVRADGLGAGGLGLKQIDWGNGQSVDQDYEGDANANATRILTPTTAALRGLSLSATNSDDLGLIAVNGAFGGKFVATLSGGVGFLSASTVAEIARGTQINTAGAAPDRGQDVHVLAGNDTRGLSVAGAAGGSGQSVLAPSASFGFVNLTTAARVFAEQLNVADDLVIEAGSTESFTSVAAGIGIAGSTGAGLSGNVLDLNSSTAAVLGGDIEFGGAANVSAGGDVVVAAHDDTKAVMFSGALGVGIGGGGVAAGANLASIVKDTTASIGAVSSVTALGAGVDDRSGSPSGIDVRANSSEAIQAFAVSGAGASGVAVGAAAGIFFIDSDTSADILGFASINQDATGDRRQSVNVAATNTVDIVAATGGLGIGNVGAAGALAVGIIRNETSATIDNGVLLDAGGTVNVTADAAQNIRSFSVSVGVGQGAFALSNGTWIIGGDFSEGGGSAEETDWTTAFQGVFDGSDFGGVKSALAGAGPVRIDAARVSAANNTIAFDLDDDGTIDESGFRTGDAVVFNSGGGGIGGLASGETYYVIDDTGSNRIRLAASSDDAYAGIAIDIGPAFGGRLSLALADSAAASTAMTATSTLDYIGHSDLAGTLSPQPFTGEGSFARIGSYADVNAAGGVSVHATDVLDFAQVNGNVAAGGVGVGASFGLLIHQNAVVASIGDQAVVAAGGTGLLVSAESSEKVWQISVGASGGSIGVSGAGVVNLLTETTQAIIGADAVITTAGPQSLVKVNAADESDIFSVSGALGFGGGAGIGAGFDVTTVTKTTEALVGRGGSIDTEGSVVLRAHSGEDITSLVATGALASGFAAAGSASVVVVDTVTRAVLGAGLGGTPEVAADGNVIITATTDGELDLFGGALAVAGGAAVGAAAAVPVVTRDTEARIASGADVTARGLRGSLLAADGGTDVTYDTSPTSTEVTSDLGGSKSNLYENQQYEDGAGPEDDSFQSERPREFESNAPGDPNAGSARTAGLRQIQQSGLVVVAANVLDVASFGIAAGAAGAVAVSLSGAVQVLDMDADASVGEAVLINGDEDTATLFGSVKVAAANDLETLNLAAAASAAALAAVSPSAAVNIVKLHTTAAIGDFSRVNAAALNVTADAEQNIVNVSVGVAGAAVAVAGSASVVSLESDTRAMLDADAVDARLGVVVGASDDTKIVVVAGSAAGAVFAAVGAAAGVILIDKETVADSTGSVIESGGAVTVSATSTEAITGVAAAGAGALFVGASGVGLITVVDSDTRATLGGGGVVAEDVSVSATNGISAFSFAGGAGGGIAGVAGGLGVGIVRNGVSAVLSGFVDAEDDVSVRAVSAKDINAFAISASVGAAALSGSVGVWTIGGAVDAGYGYEERDKNGNATGEMKGSDGLSDESQGWEQDYDDVGSGGQSGGYGSVTGERGMGSGGASSRIDSGLGSAGGRVNASGGSNSIGSQLSAAVDDDENTSARIEGLIFAGGDIEVTADDVTDLSLTIGGMAAGGAALGAAIGVANFNNSVSATSTAVLDAGGNITVSAGETRDVDAYAFVGTGGIIALGAQVIVVNDSGDQTATAGGGRVTADGSVNVAASYVADIDAGALGITPGSAIDIGASVTSVTLSGAATASFDSALQRNSGAPGADSLSIAALTDADINAQSWGAGLGALAAGNSTITNVTSTRETTAALSSPIAETQDGVTVSARDDTTAAAKSVSSSFSFFGPAVGAGVSNISLAPDITARTDGARVEGDLSVLAVGTITADATAWSLAGTLLNGQAGSIAISNVDADVLALSDDLTRVNDGDVVISTSTIFTSDATASAASGGTIGIGASVASAENTGSSVASYLGSADGIALTVSANAIDTTDAYAKTTNGGLGEANFNKATALTNVGVTASLGVGTLTDMRQLTVGAIETADTNATVDGVALLAGLSIGANTAEATHASIVNAEVGGAQITGGQALISAVLVSDVDAAASPSNGVVLFADLAFNRARTTENGAAIAESDAIFDGQSYNISATGVASLDSRADGDPIAYVGIGEMRAFATNNLLTKVRQAGEVDAASAAITVDGAAYANALSTGTTGGVYGATAVNTNVVVTPEVRLDIDGAVRATGNLDIDVRGQAEGDATARNTTIVLVGGVGVVKSNLQVDQLVVAQVAANGTLSANVIDIDVDGGQTASTIDGNGRSRLTAEGQAATPGGFVGVNEARADSSSIVIGNFFGQMDAGTDVLVRVDNRFDVITEAEGAGVGFAFSFNEAETRSSLAVVTGLVIDGRAEAGESIDVKAYSQIDNEANASMFSGGGVSAATANARADTQQLTTVVFGSDVNVVAPVISAVAESSNDVHTTQIADAGGVLVGAIAGGGEIDGLAAGSYVLAGSETKVEVRENANLNAANTLTLRAELVDSDVTSVANTTTGAVGAGSDADAVIIANEEAVVEIATGAVLRGRQDLMISALVGEDAYRLEGRTNSTIVGVVGDAHARSNVTGDIDTRIEAAESALLRTRSLMVDATNGVDATNVVAIADRDVIALATGGKEEFAPDLSNRDILFDADVELLRPASNTYELVIASSGQITTARNVTVDGRGEGEFIAPGTIHVDPIRANNVGDAVFRAGDRGVITGLLGTWTVQQGADSVSIDNRTSRDLELGAIDMVGNRIPDANDVTIDVGNAAGFKFDIVGVYDPEPGVDANDPTVRIVNGSGDVILDGEINNPIGLTHIETQGSILDWNGNANIIRTYKLELSARDSIGVQEYIPGTPGTEEIPAVEERYNYQPIRVEFVISEGRLLPRADVVANGPLAYLRVETVLRTPTLIPAVTFDRLVASQQITVEFYDARVETLPADHAGGLKVGALASATNNSAIGNAGLPISTPNFYREFYYPEGAGVTSTDYRAVFGEANDVYRPVIYTAFTPAPGSSGVPGPSLNLEKFGPVQGLTQIFRLNLPDVAGLSVVLESDAGAGESDQSLVGDLLPTAEQKPAVVLRGDFAAAFVTEAAANDEAATADLGLDMGWIDGTAVSAPMSVIDWRGRRMIAAE